MCRVLAYLGEPVLLDVLLYRSDSALVKQAYDPNMLSYMNLAGFGFASWDSGSPDPEAPFLYKHTMLPMYDRNLMQASRKLRAECLVAHVRGENYFGGSTPRVGRANLHPFQYDGAPVVLAHNGGLARFSEMRYDLVPHIAPRWAERIEGNTDSEWIYALLLSRLDQGPAGESGDGAGALAHAVEEVLDILRAARRKRGIEVASAVNLFASDGRSLVVTRFTFDFGRYEGLIDERQLDYQSLWLTVGCAYGCHDGAWRMEDDGEVADSVLMASEPLTRDVSDWIEVPEYSLVTAHRRNGGLELESRDLDA